MQQISSHFCVFSTDPQQETEYLHSHTSKTTAIPNHHNKQFNLWSRKALCSIPLYCHFLSLSVPLILWYTIWYFKCINQKPTKYTVCMEAHLINYFLINLLHISSQMGHSSCEEIVPVWLSQSCNMYGTDSRQYRVSPCKQCILLVFNLHNWIHKCTAIGNIIAIGIFTLKKILLPF